MFGFLYQSNIIMSKGSQLAGQPVLSQLLSFIPKELVASSVSTHKSDHYYKTMTTYKQLVFLLYGVISRCHSLSNLCKSLLFLEKKLTDLGIDKLPSKSTLSDANINRSSDVFATIYYKLFTHYKELLSHKYIHSFMIEDVELERLEVFDSSTISLFTDVFKGAGRKPIKGKKKGGLKIHTKLPMTSVVPDLIIMSASSKNDKTYLGQLETQSGHYIFDKGYTNYKQWEEWSEQGVFYLTRLNKNATYEVLLGQPNSIINYADGGIITDQHIQLKGTQARLVIYKDSQSQKVYQYVTNLYDCKAETIAYLYKRRWSIETLFKSLKQNFELRYFYSDSKEGIKTQVWIALIANLIFNVIHKQVKECELFTTIVAMASANLSSYISLIKVLQSKTITYQNRNLDNVQLKLFHKQDRGCFQQNKIIIDSNS